MAFHDVQLPDDVEKGATGGPGFRTAIVELQSGVEKGNIQWKNARGRYSISYGIREKELFFETLRFFYVRQGKAHKFPFRDWSDYELKDVFQFEGDGVAKTFQMVSRYESGPYEYIRPIYLPIIDTIVLKKDGVVTGGYNISNFGQVTFAAAPADGVLITASGEFHVLVRFDTDLLQLGISTWDAADVKTIELVEMRPDYA